jgi:hypothetical protein
VLTDLMPQCARIGIPVIEITLVPLDGQGYSAVAAGDTSLGLRT